MALSAAGVKKKRKHKKVAEKGKSVASVTRRGPLTPKYCVPAAHWRIWLGHCLIGEITFWNFDKYFDFKAELDPDGLAVVLILEFAFFGIRKSQITGLP